MLVDSLKAVMISRTVVENFEAVDFLEIEVIEVLFLLVDALKDVANSIMVVDNLRPPSPWRSKP